MTKMVDAPDTIREIMGRINGHTRDHPPTVQSTKTTHTFVLDANDSLVLGKRTEGNIFNVTLHHADGSKSAHGPVASREGAKLNTFLKLKRKT